MRGKAFFFLCFSFAFCCPRRVVLSLGKKRRWSGGKHTRFCAAAVRKVGGSIPRAMLFAFSFRKFCAVWVRKLRKFCDATEQKTALRELNRTLCAHPQHKAGCSSHRTINASCQQSPPLAPDSKTRAEKKAKQKKRSMGIEPRTRCASAEPSGVRCPLDH
jgi:hypothetical protein